MDKILLMALSLFWQKEPLVLKLLCNTRGWVRIERTTADYNRRLNMVPEW